MTDTAFTITQMEVEGLRDLVGQFAALVRDTRSDDDPAVARLVPDAYPDDAEAGREFRRLTESDLLRRRAEEAERVVASLPAASGAAPDAHVRLVLDAATLGAWLRTLAALRLVVATRLGVDVTDEHDPADPRFGVYDWLAYRLDGLLEAAETV